MLKFGACDFLIRWALVVIYFTLQKTCKACIEADGYVRDKEKSTSIILSHDQWVNALDYILFYSHEKSGPQNDRKSLIPETFYARASLTWFIC